MLAKIASLLLLACVGIALCSDAEVTLEFSKFLQQFGKKYDTIEETIKRYNIFKENYNYIVEHNGKKSDYKLGVNQFADLTMEEFKAMYLSPKPKTSTPCTLKHIPIEGKPEIDWRKSGKVADVDSQGSCGSCWAFSAIGAVEGLRAIKLNQPMLELSKQELIDCSASYGNKGCSGGEISQAFEYVKDNGISTEKEYHYEGLDRKCRKKSKTFTISGCVNVTADDSNALLEALAYGPVSIAVRANNRDFMYYRSGIISQGCGTDASELDHAILLAGAAFDVESKMPYWIVRNSWGRFWGQEGYVYIKRDTVKGHGVCGIAMENAYPIL